ncbi:hypothetical protein HNR44_000788 [Geomicrobium halophilum]|uniref:YqzL-like protein n=1 Tax=Geomicrobium halophilum TaxID=549000 RepID=A0A841PJD4_9BACL|nr:YqzL family protein [Geomicrobium halophilum]MBB6448839.1 hypothetical protein [Geomicrobium halophilum]
MLNYYWKLFSLTGDLDTYLKHKEYERMSEDPLQQVEDESLKDYRVSGQESPRL